MSLGGRLGNPTRHGASKNSLYVLPLNMQMRQNHLQEFHGSSILKHIAKAVFPWWAYLLDDVSCPHLFSNPLQHTTISVCDYHRHASIVALSLGGSIHSDISMTFSIEESVLSKVEPPHGRKGEDSNPHRV